MLGERWPRRHGEEREEPGELVGLGGQEVAVPLEDLRRAVDRPQRRARDHRGHGVEPQRQRRDDAVVPAAPTDRPEEVLVVLGVGGDEAPVGQHDVRGEDVVDRQAELACGVADAAAEREPMPVVEMMPTGVAKPNACAA